MTKQKTAGTLTDDKPVKPVRRKQEDRSAATRARVIQACIDTLYEEGYGAASTVRVCTQADISRGALLNQFPTKSDLMLAVLTDLYGRHLAFIRARADQITDPLRRFRDLLQITWEAQNRPVGYAILEIIVGSRSDPVLPSEFSEKIRPIVAQTASLADSYAAEAALTLDEDDHDLLHLLAISVRGLMVEALINPGVDSARLIKRLSEMCEHEMVLKKKPI